MTGTPALIALSIAQARRTLEEARDRPRWRPPPRTNDTADDRPAAPPPPDDERARTDDAPWPRTVGRPGRLSGRDAPDRYRMAWLVAEGRAAHRTARDRLSPAQAARARARISHPSTGLVAAPSDREVGGEARRVGHGRRRAEPTLAVLDALRRLFGRRTRWTASVGVIGVLAGYGRTHCDHDGCCSSRGGRSQCLAHARRAVHDHLQILVAAGLIARVGYHHRHGATIWRWRAIRPRPALKRQATILDAPTWTVPRSEAVCCTCAGPVRRSPRGPPDRQCGRCYMRRVPNRYFSHAPLNKRYTF